MATETFTDRMVDKTLGRAIQPKRGQNYNYGLRWFAKPDGDIVQLQSDPQARAYYADKGYHLLAESPARGESMSEVEEWERLERPRLIEEQKLKAKLINAIRKTDTKDPTLLLDIDEIDRWSIAELEDQVKEIRSRGGKIIVREDRARPPEDPNQALLKGVEVVDSLEDLQRKLGAEGAQAKTIQSGGYDPIDQSRRRSRSNG